MLFDCPECGLPCTVEPRGYCGSTDGPVEVVYVRCVNRHWFLGPADRLRLTIDPRVCEPPPAAPPGSATETAEPRTGSGAGG